MLIAFTRADRNLSAKRLRRTTDRSGGHSFTYSTWTRAFDEDMNMEVCSADGHDTQFWLLCVHFTIRRHLCWLAFNGVFLFNSIDGTSVLFFFVFASDEISWYSLYRRRWKSVLRSLPHSSFSFASVTNIPGRSVAWSVVFFDKGDKRLLLFVSIDTRMHAGNGDDDSFFNKGLSSTSSLLDAAQRSNLLTGPHRRPAHFTDLIESLLR